MPRSNSPRVRQREELAWSLCARGMTERRIAEEIAKAGLGKITQQGVSAMLCRVESRALKELSDRVGGLKARQTESLWRIYEEALAAWERSKLPQKSLTTKRTGDGEGAAAETVSVIRDQDGDPRYLDLAMSALADIRKTWGAEAPKKAELTGKGGGPIETTEAPYDLSKLGTDELRQLADLLERATPPDAETDRGPGGTESAKPG